MTNRLWEKGVLTSSKFTTNRSLITYIGVGNRAYESRFTVSHMANGTDIDGGLARDDLKASSIFVSLSLSVPNVSLTTF